MTQPDDFTCKHLALWCERESVDGSGPEMFSAIYSFCTEHGWDLAERGWREVLMLAEREQARKAG